MGNIITLKTDVVWHFATGAPTGLKNPSGHLLAGTIYVKVPANAESTKITLSDGTSDTGSFSSGGGWPLQSGSVSVVVDGMTEDGFLILKVTKLNDDGIGLVKVEYSYRESRPVSHAEYSLDTFNWSGTQVCTAGQFTNLMTLPLVRGVNSGVVTISDGKMIFPAKEGLSGVNFVVRFAGEFPTATSHKWRVQLRRPDNTTLSSVTDTSDQQSFTIREAAIHSYIADPDDPFVETGIMLGIVVTGSEDLTLSSLTVRVDRIFNV